MIPLWAISGIAAASVAGFAGYQIGAGIVQAKLDRERAAWAEIRVTAAEAAADWERKARAADEQARNTEHTWLAAARAIDQDGAQHAEKLRADSDRAGAAVVGLRAQLGAVVAESTRVAEASASAADARERQAAGEATRMFADLLGSCHERSAARARYADAAGGAGARCQRWGESLTIDDSGIKGD